MMQFSNGSHHGTQMPSVGTVHTITIIRLLEGRELMISDFTLKFGRTPGTTGDPIAVTPVTVFVGPNNSGKSRVLSEIETYCRSGQPDQNAVLLLDMTFTGLSPESSASAIEAITSPMNPGESINVGNIIIGSRYGRFQVTATQLDAFVQDPSKNVRAFCGWFLTHYTLSLNGTGRIQLIQDQPAGDLMQPAQNSLQKLFQDDVKRHEVRRIVYDAFGLHFVIDPTNLGNLRVRLSNRAPSNDLEERGIHNDAVQFQTAALPISLASDGVKAFTGIITELIAGDPRVVLIDEPEAFLHPSLSTKLGNEVSRAVINTDKRVFVSTHSAAFVMGCIQSGAPVNIIRLTYRGGVATSRVLPSNELIEIMRHPLLRSTGVLNGLFYEFVVVTESDADRAFYQEINERLLQFRPEWGIPNCLFINAQNKQTIPTIISPLRKLGIPAAGIVDIDALKDGGKTWTALLSSAGVPSISHGPLAALRSAVKSALENSGRDMKRDGGVAILSDPDREAAENLLGQLADYGVFVVPGGELESWLRHLGTKGHGPGWLVDLFERFGEDPLADGFVKPADGDVWAFVRNVKNWMVDPNRKGIPA